MSWRSSIPAAGVAKAKGEQDLAIVSPVLPGFAEDSLTSLSQPSYGRWWHKRGRLIARLDRTATLFRRVNASLPIKHICYARCLGHPSHGRNPPPGSRLRRYGFRHGYAGTIYKGGRPWSGRLSLPK